MDPLLGPAQANYAGCPALPVWACQVWCLGNYSREPRSSRPSGTDAARGRRDRLNDRVGLRWWLNPFGPWSPGFYFRTVPAPDTVVWEGWFGFGGGTGSNTGICIAALGVVCSSVKVYFPTGWGKLMLFRVGFSLLWGAFGAPRLPWGLQWLGSEAMASFSASILSTRG
jgi:hypothetical protein